MPLPSVPGQTFPLTVGIYGGGPLQNKNELEALKRSSFNTIICWSMHVNSQGDLIYNDGEPIAHKGSYTGPPAWPAQLESLTQGADPPKRLVFSVGAAGCADFRHIRMLFNKHGSGPENPLHGNFSALRKAIPQLSKIDFDNEDDYDEATIVSFAQMLHKIGFAITFCPYNRMKFWEGALRTLHGIDPAIVVGYNLQCYAGGTRNASVEELRKWIMSVSAATNLSFKDAATFVRPGLWCRHNDCKQGLFPIEIANTLAEWGTLGMGGAWIWLYDDVKKNEKCEGADTSLEAYAVSIIAGLSEP